MIFIVKIILILITLAVLLSVISKCEGMDAQQHKDFIRENYINPTINPK